MNVDHLFLECPHQVTGDQPQKTCQYNKIGLVVFQNAKQILRLIKRMPVNNVCRNAMLPCDVEYACVFFVGNDQHYPRVGGVFEMFDDLSGIGTCAGCK